jgi:crotonobetainyl-CoA:carnitine CoA-transferase CaiB-like acyl-CoA transferase
MMTSDQILKDITVLDCSIAMAGPFAAQRLGDLGANVIKVEPLDGEWQRRTAAGGACGKRINTSFLSLNRNKRSLAVNLKTDAGRELLYRLVDTADVFLQNYRPGVAERLRVDYEALRARRPDLVYVSISGYGEDGPYRSRPGQDLLLQAMSGAMLSSGREDDPPTPAGQYTVDAVTAYCAFEGALAALFHRERTGQGQRVDVNMLDAIVAVQMQELSIFTAGKIPQTRSSQPHGHVYIRSPYGIFETRDHKYIALAFPSLNALGKALDIEEFLPMEDEIDNHRFRDEIFARTQAAIREHDAEPLLRLMDEQGIWTTLVYGYEELVNDPQVKHNGSFIEYDHPTEGRVLTPGFPIRFGLTPSRVNRGAPLPGEHTTEILSTLGFSDEEIDDLREQAIVAETKI